MILKRKMMRSLRILKTNRKRINHFPDIIRLKINKITNWNNPRFIDICDFFFLSYYHNICISVIFLTLSLSLIIKEHP